MTTPLCSICEEQSAEFKLSLTTKDGELIDSAEVCEDCLKSSQVVEILSIN